MFALVCPLLDRNRGIDLEIQLLRLVQLALAGTEILKQRSEEVRHQSSGLMSIGGIRLAELGTHPLFLHAELDPEREEEENENDEPAHLGDGNRHAKETGQNAGVDGVTNHGIGTGSDQLVALLNGDGAAPVLVTGGSSFCRGARAPRRRTEGRRW